MKANSDNYPKKIQSLGNGKYFLNYNIVEVEIDERISYNCESLYVDDISRESLISALIAEKYSIADEIKLLYRGTPEQVQEHECWVTWCKEYVDNAMKEL